MDDCAREDRLCSNVENHAAPHRRVPFRFLLLLVDLAPQLDPKVVDLCYRYPCMV
jgi:hypothetical protein